MQASVLVFTVTLLSAAAFARADTASGLRATLSTNSTLWLEGDSTLHRFESTATTIGLDTEVVLKPGGEMPPSVSALCGTNGAPSLARLVLTIPIKDMKSSVAGLASQMQKALKAKEHPDIVFTMGGYRVDVREAETNRYGITVEGIVALAGGTSNITVTMTGALDGDALRIKGEKDLLMSSFGVTPPTLFFGAIKTADKVVIKWDMGLTLTSGERSQTMPSDGKP